MLTTDISLYSFTPQVESKLFFVIQKTPWSGILKLLLQGQMDCGICRLPDSAQRGNSSEKTVEKRRAFIIIPNKQLLLAHYLLAKCIESRKHIYHYVDSPRYQT